MKIKILILLSLLLLVFFATNACSVDWSNQGSQTVDQMFSGDQGATNLPPGEYSSPAAARAAESKQKGKGILNVSIGGKLAGDASSPQAVRSQDQVQKNSVQEVAADTTNTSNTTAPEQLAPSTEPTSVSGSWSMELADSAPRTAALILFQSGDAVFGTGNLNLDANNSLIVTASGTISGDALNLDMVSLKKVNLYRITLTVNGDSATGSYTNYSPSASPTNGTAKGTRSIPSS